MSNKLLLSYADAVGTKVVPKEQFKIIETTTKYQYKQVYSQLVNECEKYCSILLHNIEPLIYYKKEIQHYTNVLDKFDTYGIDYINLDRISMTKYKYEYEEKKSSFEKASENIKMHLQNMQANIMILTENYFNNIILNNNSNLYDVKVEYKMYSEFALTIDLQLLNNNKIVKHLVLHHSKNIMRKTNKWMWIVN